MQQDAAEKEIEDHRPWFYDLHLPNGKQTDPDHPLGDFPARKWLSPHLPKDLNRWQIIDIGCNTGFYSFELARRGATVTATDFDRHYLKQARCAVRYAPGK